MAKQQPTNTEDKKPTKADTLSYVLKMHKQWQDYRKELLSDWKRDTRLYNNERVSENRYEGVSDTFVPLAFGTVETIKAALSTGNLNTDFLPQDIYKYLQDRFEPRYDPSTGLEKDEWLVEAIKEAISGGVIEDETLGVLNALYDYHWDIGDWDLMLEDLIGEGIKTGTGSWWLTWNDGKPELETVPFPDFIFDPAAKNDKKASFNGRRYMADIDDLRAETIIDPETEEEKPRYKIPKNVGVFQNKDEKDKHDKEMKEDLLYSSTLNYEPKDNKQVEIIELQTNDKSYKVLNRKHVIEDTDNPFKAQGELMGVEYKGFLSGITWANYRDSSLLVGKSEIATFWQEQERLNDVTNQKSDAVTRALLQQKLADPALKPQKNSMLVDGAVIWGSKGQYENVDQATVPNAAFNEEGSIKSNIREVTATGQMIKGVSDDDDITATEAKIQTSQSGNRNELKVRSLERGPLKSLATKVLYLYQIFITDPFIVPESANNGMSVSLYDPKNYKGDFIPKVKLNIDAKNEEQREKRENLQTYQILIADPTNNLQAVKETLLPKITGLDKDQVKRIAEGQQQPLEAQA